MYRYQAAVDYIDAQIENDFADVDSRRHVTVEKGHGRQERRITIQMPAPASLPGFGRWAGLRTIGSVVLLSLRDGKETSEMRYFISSLAMGVKRFARAVRGHWGIENSCHWSLDFTYREDESRIRDECLRENMAWLHRSPVHIIIAEATSEQRQHHHETPRLRLERRLPDGSPYRGRKLVCAGPGRLRSGCRRRPLLTLRAGRFSVPKRCDIECSSRKSLCGSSTRVNRGDL